MPELESISIEGFTSIARLVDLKLSQINILIGANGAGKSNLMRAFSFLHAIRAGHLQRYVAQAGGAEDLLHFGSKMTDFMQFRLVFEDQINQFEIRLTPNDRDELFPVWERVSFWNKAAYEQPLTRLLDGANKEAGISQNRAGGVAGYVRDRLGRWRVYHFHDTGQNSPMKKAININDHSFLRFDGSNIAAFLNLLKNNHLDHYEIIRHITQRVAPFFDDFVLEPNSFNRDLIRLAWRHKQSDSYFDVSSLSDGTLRFIALAVLLLQPEDFKPSLIIIDEPELGLHPYAINILASMIKSAAARTQIIISTQSSLLLDHFSPEDVLVAERDNGATVVHRLDPEPLELWLANYSLGQLWEKNEFGGRPKPE
jgi:predicted ATPase